VVIKSISQKRRETKQRRWIFTNWLDCASQIDDSELQEPKHAIEPGSVRVEFVLVLDQDNEVKSSEWSLFSVKEIRPIAQ